MLLQGQVLVDYARGHTRLLAAPPLELAGFENLVAHKGSAGYQQEKQRGTLQSTHLDQITRAVLEAHTLEDLEENTDALGEWLEAAIDGATGEGGTLLNYFLNINKGEKALGGSGDNQGWHEDHPTDPDKNTGRVLFYHMTDRQHASLGVRRGNAEVEPTR